jgi:RNA polymerase sigma-70 factor (ECF subfamily)
LLNRRQLVSVALARRLYDRSSASRWSLAVEAFHAVLERSLAHAAGDRAPAEPEIERLAEALHLDDLALASACAAGVESAWEHFVAQHRHGLHRAAEAIDRSGGARDLADAIHAELFGLREKDGERQSLFRYYHGRSSLQTWLRAVLSQRFVDRVRERRRLEPLDEDRDAAAAAGPARPAREPDADRARFLPAMSRALAATIAALVPRDRLRLSSYYAEDLTLAAIGRLLGEHEATVSRHLSRTRREVRAGVERRLREDAGFDDRTIEDCFRAVLDDAGPLDLADLFGEGPAGGDRKNRGQDRSR